MSKSKLKAVAEQVVMEALNGAKSGYIAMVVEQVEEIIEYERKEMPAVAGYRRERALIGRCRRACDDYLPGAVLVNHVLSRFGRKGVSGLIEFKGDRWIWQTRDWWCYELGLTRHEYDRALSIAKKNELLHVRHAKLTPKGLPMTLIRPSERARLLHITFITAVKEAKAIKEWTAAKAA